MKKIHIALCAILGLSSLSAVAEDKNLVAAGFGYIAVNSSSPDFASNGPAFLTPQPAGLTVGSASTLLFGFSHMVSDHWAVALAGGIPPKHDIFGRGNLAPFGVITTVKQFAPTVFANYHFNESGSKFRPFVGLGINYTKFYDITSQPAGNLASGGPTSVTLSSYTGLAATIGMNYKIADHWYINANIAAADVSTDMVATTGSIQRTTHVKLNPILYSAGIAYSF
ncbi:outer membrane beta-barrel protein [Undibacterium jejuense]|uniref:Outer membrane beta-barrel protein n=1 Tax=Undibacterium jejuense TaxID=1344949 RepID=A0A923HGQ3_9BURK|nr:OmpW family outer membrane protein [Undibacterium jejuense]MBC3862098.1 outer membrane beta-barrel protein [Undibacterium jejuense]